MKEDKREMFHTWTFEAGCNRNDALLKEIEADLAGRGSILEMFSRYMEELRLNPDNDALPFRKMAKLFECGGTPERVAGHHYGVPMCFRTGDLSESLASIGNILEILWGLLLYGQSPWVGKSFSPVDSGLVNAITQGAGTVEGEAFLGVNHFNKIPLKLPNNISYFVLDALMNLETPPPAEGKAFGHEKNGGNFIAGRGSSMNRNTDREVFSLNYRWKNLKNIPPLRWLIDELVQIADGLYLGQLLFATDKLFDEYDPACPVADYAYQNFGYFLLFDERWNGEARRLFPFLEIPENAPGVAAAPAAGNLERPKFSTFTFEEEECAPLNESVFQAVLADFKNSPTILHLLKYYSDSLQGTSDNNSPFFLKVQELFNRGIGITDMEGYYRGALVSWHSEGIFKLFDVNTISMAYNGLAVKFSTWTGKAFDAISRERLGEITDGFEKGEVPTRWGSNTQALRTFKEKFVGKLTEIARVWNEPVDYEEAQRNGYDVKNFFFIARQGCSLSRACPDKPIYQLNYRWPKLRTIIPDCYCIDELVQIAEGLYIGQLMYATKVFLPYDPAADPALYEYRNFGFFLLMDEEWHQIRLQIGYDLSNA
jgi:hypothetical protein